jgi:hypothetical protein
MEEVDELWKPDTWDIEAQDLMIQRVGKGFEQCLDLSEGSTCTFSPPSTSDESTWGRFRDTGREGELRGCRYQYHLAQDCFAEVEDVPRSFGKDNGAG